MPEREDTRPIKVEVRNLTKRFGDSIRSKKTSSRY